MSTYTILYQTQPDWSVIPAVELQETGWLAPAAISARAQLCHDGSALYVRMEAEEAAVRATLSDPLSQVCNDSCLEFFFAPDMADARYINFEFNPLGTMYLGFGAARPTRVRQIVKKPDELFAPRPFTTDKGWGICWRIPFSFIQLYFPAFAPTGECAANFYKCGDETVQPHYLSWAPMHCDTPDFHRRQDFGTLRFA